MIDPFKNKICDKCKELIGKTDVVIVTQMTDKDENPIENGPVTYFHRTCAENWMLGNEHRQ
jgi:hypothetical protein